MDKKFFPVMGLVAIIFMSQLGGRPLGAAEPSPPLRQPPTAAEIEKAYENCFKHECENFGEWSVDAWEVCSEGGAECCERAREILASIHTTHRGKEIYDNYFPHSFEGDDVEEITPDDVERMSR